MAITLQKPKPPSEDKRWKMIAATMRRHGYSPNSLIEVLHGVQGAFGYLDDDSMTYVAESLGLPLSKVFGVATFYHLFSLKPQGEHTCVICTGTACYIKGATELVDAVGTHFDVKLGETTADKKLSVTNARCIGACSIAPAAVVDGEVHGKLSVDELLARIEKVI